MLQDQAIDWIRKRQVWSYWELKALIVAAVDEGTTNVFTEGELIQNPTSSSKTAPDINLMELGTLGIVGAYFTAAGTILLGEVDLPYDLDPKYPVGFRINWSGAGTAAASKGCTWTLLPKVIKKGVAFTTPTVALDTPIAQSLISATDCNEWSPRGIKKSLGISRKDIEDGAALALSIACTTLTTGVTLVKLLNLEMDYVPQMTLGNGCHTDRPIYTHGRG